MKKKYVESTYIAELAKNVFGSDIIETAYIVGENEKDCENEMAYVKSSNKHSKGIEFDFSQSDIILVLKNGNILHFKGGDFSTIVKLTNFEKPCN